VYISLFFTRQCNLNCSYCKTSKRIATKDISIDKWKYIIDILHDRGCRHITIYGGEPTIRPDLVDMIKYCTKKEILTHVVSNGLLINEDMLKEYVKNGYFILGISIDNFYTTKTSQKIYRPEFIELLREINESEEVTVITATHDHKMLSVSDRIAWIRDGQVERYQKRDEIEITEGKADVIK